MLNIGMPVKVLPNAEYGGKYTGCVGVVRNYYSSKKKAGVELEQIQNDASSKGLFWFSEDKLAPATRAAYDYIRRTADPVDRDIIMYGYLDKFDDMLKSGGLVEAVEKVAELL